MRSKKRRSGSEGGRGKPTAATQHGAHDSPYATSELNGGIGITVEELQAAMRAVEPRALYVTPRILRRVIKKHRGIAGIGLRVPHAESYWLPLGDFARIVDLDELPCPVSDLGDPVLLLAEPDPDDLSSVPREAALTQLWRELFHLRVHLAFDARLRDGALTPAAIRQRIHRIGQPEFDEIRRVLRHEDAALPPRRDENRDTVLYGEFAALYLQLRYFDPASIPRYFPILTHTPVDAILLEDLDAGALFVATRPPACSDPVIDEKEGEEPTGGSLDVHLVGTPHEKKYRRLSEQAPKAGQRGNAVRAAILWKRAALSAPPSAAGVVADRFEQPLESLCSRLEALLEGRGPSAEAWHEALRPLLTPGTAGFARIEGRLLYDLQKACNEYEREDFRVDLVEWALSLGRRPIKRSLPGLRVLLPLRHVATARSRLAAVRLTEEERRRLAPLLAASEQSLERRLRERFRPILLDTVQRSGLPVGSVVIARARDKLVEELLDRIVAKGFFHFSELRDAIARNQAKLGDLTGPKQLLLGDPLLRIDRALAPPLEGVYRRGEVYLRFLQRFSSLFFGTASGRVFTRYLALPFLAAFVALAGLQHLHLINFLAKPLTGAKINIVAWPYVLGLGLFLVPLVNSERFRRVLLRGVKSCWRLLRLAFYTFPRWILARPLVRAVQESRPWRFFVDYIFWPAFWLTPVVLLMFWSITSHWLERALSIAIWVATSVLSNATLGHRIKEAIGDFLVRAWRRLRYQILPNIVRFTLQFFTRVLELIERLLYTVDEWLRFKQGEPRVGLVIKPAIGLVWFFVTYVVRIYVRVLIEPQVNPIKHFPVVTVSHKVILPMSFEITRVLRAPFLPLGSVIANTIAVSTMFLIPGVFGFLVWELKENWRLFGRNRSSVLKPVLVGAHGETVVRLVRPGFHSGTLIKLFNRLRRVRSRGLLSGRARARRAVADGLHHVEEGLRHFVEREAVALLNGSPAWRGGDPTQAGVTGVLHVGEIQLASNRIRIAIGPNHDEIGFYLTFEEQSGYLLANLSDAGGLARLAPGQRTALELAVAGLYKLAGVDLVRQQIEATLPGTPAYDIADEGLVVWPGQGYRTEVVYPLDPERERLLPGIRLSEGHTSPDLSSLPARDVFFHRTPIRWTDWQSAWDRDGAGQGLPTTLLAGTRLLPA